jgi:hypothetical protein
MSKAWLTCSNTHMPHMAYFLLIYNTPKSLIVIIILTIILSHEFGPTFVIVKLEGFLLCFCERFVLLCCENSRLEHVWGEKGVKKSE